MKPVFAAVVALVLGSACTSLAQTMVEYSSLAGKGAPVPKALSTKINAANEKIAAAGADSSSQHTVPKSSVQSKGATTEPGQEATAKPAPPAVFILSNGQRVESDHYVLTTEGVRLQDKGAERTIPMKELNVSATKTANEERGLHLMFPTSTSQMTISF